MIEDISIVVTYTIKRNQLEALHWVDILTVLYVIIYSTCLNMNMIQQEREVINMIRNGRVIAYHTCYVNNIFYNESFTFTDCHIQGYSLFYWFKRNYGINENYIYKYVRR